MERFSKWASSGWGGSGRSGAAMYDPNRPPPMSSADKLKYIWTWPAEVFKDVYHYPDWLTPFVFASLTNIISAAASFRFDSKAKADFAIFLWRGKELGHQIEMPVDVTSAAHPGLRFFLAPLAIIAIWLVVAGVIAFAGFLLDSVEFNRLFSVVAFSSLPLAFRPLIDSIAKNFSDPSVASMNDWIRVSTPWTLSPARFIPPGTLYKVLSSFDLFALWSVYLLYVGLVFGLGNDPRKASRVAFLYAIVAVLVIAFVRSWKTSVG
ncbi:MAG: YIP1 family protein [bacterium]|jgi:hypothetical protein